MFNYLNEIYQKYVFFCNFYLFLVNLHFNKSTADFHANDYYNNYYALDIAHILSYYVHLLHSCNFRLPIDA